MLLKLYKPSGSWGCQLSYELILPVARSACYNLYAMGDIACIGTHDFSIDEAAKQMSLHAGLISEGTLSEPTAGLLRTGSHVSLAQV